jgi:tripartite-type tricarboxylate transporter receptor subunit TctC
LDLARRKTAAGFGTAANKGGPRMRALYRHWCMTTATASALAAVAMAAPVHAANFYDNKTITIMVGLAPGGTVDTLARQFAQTWQNYIPGKPTMVVKNMTGGGGMKATNYVYEAAPKDGTVLYYGTWIPVAQALHYPGFKAHYEKFNYIGGVGDTRVVYARTDTIPGGLKKPADIMKAKVVWLGGNAATGSAHLSGRIPLDVLGVPYKQIVGYRGGSDIFLAMESGEVQVTATSIGTFRTRSGSFIKSGKGIGLFYLVPVEADGTFERNKYIPEMPAFPDLYKEVHGKMPSGPTWEALNWFTNLIGTMEYIGLAPPGTPKQAVADLRTGFDKLSKDPEVNKKGMERNGVPYEWVPVPKGEKVIRTLADTDPKVLAEFQRLLDVGSKVDKVVAPKAKKKK